jgi:hypothetical protein
MSGSSPWYPNGGGTLEEDLIELIMYGVSDGIVTRDEAAECKEEPGTYAYAADLVIDYLREKGVVLDG